MNTLKRIDPRRPFTMTAEGLKRITLGVTGAAAAAEFDRAAAPRIANSRNRAARRPRRNARCWWPRMRTVAHWTITLARRLAAAALIADASTEVVLLVFGEFSGDAAALGADKLIVLPMFDRRTFAPLDELNALAACVAAYAPVHVFLPDNATGDGDLGRRYAAAANASVATHVVELDAAHVAAYIHANTALAARALARRGAARAECGRAEIAVRRRGRAGRVAFRRRCGFALSAVRDLGIDEIDAAQLALEEADFIVSAGNGVSDVPAFERLAATLGAAIGASRVAVDDGRFTRDKQIGATGKTVEASVYIAFGISGAVQHLQGIKDCRHVIAVNLDASAPIAKRANLTVIADAQETIAALNEAAAAARSARGTGAALLNSTAVAEGALA